MVQSISTWLTEVLQAGVTHLACEVSRDPQMDMPVLTIRPLHPSMTDAPPARVFLAEDDMLLPMDGVQTFSEAVMRSGMTPEQKMHWLLITLQDYEQRVALAPAEPMQEG